MAYVDVAGATLYYEEYGRDGPPILLIPPSGATAATWGGVVDGLAAVGRVITYDRRGYSRSGGEVVRSVAVHTSDAVALLEAVATAPAVAVGTSAGATIALDLAVRRPDLVRAVVVHEAPWRALRHPTVSALVTLARMEWLTLNRRHSAAADVLLRYVYAYRDGGSAWDAFPDKWRQIARHHGRAVVSDLHSTLGERPRARDLATITVPVCCTYGSRSRTYMRSTMRALADVIPTATLREIAGAAHAAPFDAADEFVQAIASVMTSATRSGTSLGRKKTCPGIVTT
jgi:pimeloyl-ACP methyl ester carboxylesterase